jgi:histidine triad (HIT) family protein
MEPSIFTKIIRRELPAEILYEDDKVIVILNRFPNIAGETLVITKEQISYIFDLDDATYEYLMLITKKVAKALDKAFGTIRTCVVIEGFDVPHIHIRLYPVVEGRLNLTQGSIRTDKELKIVGDKIRPYLA